MKKVIIIGSSIAGSTAALALSKSFDITVYDKKRMEEVSEKLCGNICTYSIEKLIDELGLEGNFVLSRYERINVFSRNNVASFPTREYEIDRKALLREMIRKAERNGVEFNFSTGFVKLEKRRGNYEVFLEKNGKTFSDKADIIIGADGALSGVAKSIGRANREFFLFLQARVRREQIGKKQFIPEKSSYSIFIGKNSGHYSYIFPSKDGKEFKIGLGDDYEKDVSEQFRLFLASLGVKNARIEGALIPKPKIVKGKGKVYLIGDSSCNVKYSGGGIIPSLEQALALNDELSGKPGRMARVRRKTRINRRITRMMGEMGDKDFDRLLDILKDRRFEKIFSIRDDLNNSDILRMLSPRLLLLSTKIMLRP